MEQLVLRTIDYQLTLPTVKTFLRLLLHKSQADRCAAQRSGPVRCVQCAAAALQLEETAASFRQRAPCGARRP
jgi:hypothetical protein